ncbi:hypothetical protein ACHAXR_004549 [Thalassiosira sp. AJA248-18]
MAAAPLIHVLPRASPPQSQAGPGPPLPLIRKQRSSNGNQSSSLLRIIAVAIVFVLAFHWYLVLHHVSYHAPRGHLHGGLPGWERPNSISGSQTSSKINKKKKKDAYILSNVCGGCYRTNSNNMPCSDLIEIYMKHHNGTSLYDALQHVGTTNKECSICNPETCYNNNKEYQTKYWRFDQSAPKFTSPTSLVLPSIPDELRIPPDRFNDIEPYIKTKYANPDPENITNVFLFEYNPGLAPIPQHMRAYLPWNARYLLSLRVTPHNFCFGEWLTKALPEDIKQTMHSLNHMGLALLDENYQMIPGYDVVIDIDRQLDAKQNRKMGEPAFVDYRLFTLNNEMYLHINSDTVIITKLRLRAKGIDGSKGGDPMEKTDLNEKQFKLKNLYGGNQLEVTLLHQFNTIWGEGKRSVFGKNYALFSIPNGTHPTEPGAVYAEMSTFPEHMVQQIFPDEYEKIPKDRRIKWRQRRNFKIDHMIQRRVKTADNATISSSDNGKPVPSFFNVDEHWFPGKLNPFKEFTHGGACCVSFSFEDFSASSFNAQSSELNLEGIDSLFVGVAHTLVKYYTKNKLPSGLVPDTNYVSFFYAFDPRPPFKLVARSGYFCLGFASTSKSEEGGVINPHSVLTHNRPLQQNNETFACPQIHYVETIIEKVDDPSSVVIGYGMNDCTARLVEVSKKEIARLLFPDPWDMVLSKPPR